MSHSARVLALALICAALPPAASRAENEAGSEAERAALERRIVELTAKVEMLERRLAAPAPARAHAPAPNRPAAPDAAAQAEARALYEQVDRLLSAGSIDEARQALDAFREKYAGTAAVNLTGGLSRELEVIGKPVPESWAIEKWFQGEASARLAGARPTLLVFWEVWCPHCKNEVPHMQELYERYKGRGLEVVGLTRLTRDTTEEAVRHFLEEKQVAYPVAKESGAVAEYFHVKGIPAAAVVKDGKVVWRGHPMRITEEMLERWLGA